MAAGFASPLFLLALADPSVIDLRIDTHDGGDYFLPQPFAKKLKLRKGTHLLGTWKRSYDRLPTEKQQILEEVNQIAKEMRAAQQQIPSQGLPGFPNQSEADYLTQQLQEFQDLQEKLTKIEHAIEIQRSQTARVPILSEEQRRQIQFLLDEENQIMALHFALAEKIKELNNQEQEALAIIIAHE